MINRAAEIGPLEHPWWPDWRGECAVIVASGPSVNRDQVARLKDRIHVVAIKESFELCPWADVVYGCDAAWWLHRRGLPEFKGVKIAHGQQAMQYKDIHRALIPVVASDEIMVEKPLTIGSGGNSGFQALNLAIQFGATDIILVGYDLKADPNHLHWYGRNKWLNANNPMGTNFMRWKKGFDAARKQVDKLKVAVIDASRNGDMRSFRKAGLEETMEEWGL